MKKLIPLLLLLILTLTGCGSEPEHKIAYVGVEKATVADRECVGIVTEYTNGSSETAIAADWVNVKAFQNGTELTILVPTEKTNGYIQCDMSVQAGVTCKVIWCFELEDNSPITVELSDGTKVEVNLDET